MSFYSREETERSNNRRSESEVMGGSDRNTMSTFYTKKKWDGKGNKVGF